MKQIEQQLVLKYYILNVYKEYLKSVNIQNDLKSLIRNLVTAILGASGAVRTSTLNIYARRISISRNVSLLGDIKANRQPYDIDKFTQFSSFVMQNDVLFGTLTQKVTFEFVANLKYGNPQQKEKYAIIGNTLIKGISVRQTKRALIDVEVGIDPYCIILDEPTSGFNQFTAFVIMFLYNNLIKKHNLFDCVVLLVQGRFIYHGRRDQMVDHFNSYQTFRLFDECDESNHSHNQILFINYRQ